MTDSDKQGWILCVVVSIAVVAIAGVMLFGYCADHRVRAYYLDTVNDAEFNMLGGVCVYADNPWEGDDKVYCSLDSAKAIDFVNKANEALAKRPK